MVVLREADPITALRLLEESNILGYSWIEKRTTYRYIEDPVETTFRDVSTEIISAGSVLK